MSMTLPGLEIIEALDFDYDPPCEHRDHHVDPIHSGVAHVIARGADCACGPGKTVYLCEGFWNWVQNDFAEVECLDCGDVWPRAREAYLFVQRVN